MELYQPYSRAGILSTFTPLK